jgi:hypothetical protein
MRPQLVRIFCILTLALLAVKAPAQPLTIVSAVWPCEADNLTVSFNQPVDPSTATNGAHYAINQGITVDMVIMGAQPNQVIVFAWPLAVGINYTLTVNNVSTATNPPDPIAPNSQIDFGCDVPPPCPVATVSFNTGLDHVSGALYPIGAADPFWIVVSDPDPGTTEPRPTAVIGPHPAWQAALPNSGWISAYATAQNNLNGAYDLQTSFCLREGWNNAALNLCLRADDWAEVFLNNTLIATTPNPSFNTGNPTCVTVTNQALFVTGSNVLRVRLHNAFGVAMGLNLAGDVSAEGLSLQSPECCQPGSSLSGQKFHDANGNGIFDQGEQALPGWTIELSNGDTAVTDSNGFYYFLNLPPGTYTINEVAQPNWVQTAPAALAHTVTLGAAQSISGLDFGNLNCVRIACPRNIEVNCEGPEGTFVEFEATATSACSEDVTVICTPASPGPFMPGTTVVTCVAIDGNGNMARCQFTVTVLAPPLEVRCPDEIIIEDCPAVIPDLTRYIGLNYCGPLSDLTITQNPAPNTAAGPGTHVITVTVTDPNGNQVECATILTVRCPCEAERISLNTGFNHPMGALYPIGASDAFWTVTADPDPGTTEPRPAGVINSYPGWQAAQPGSHWISAYPGPQNNLNGAYDFQTQFCLLEGWRDVTLNLCLRADDWAEVFVNGTLVLSTQQPSFNTANPDCVSVVNQALFQTGTNTVLVRVHNTHAVAMGVNLTGSVSGQGIALDKPECCQRDSSLSGQKFHDLNGNGIFDPGEPGLAGWTLELSNGDSAVTDSNGYYYFMNLPPGTYMVNEVMQPGWIQTAPSSGMHTVTLGSAQSISGLDFGNQLCIRIQCPPSFEAVECQGPDGTYIDFQAQATSACGEIVSIVCTPAAPGPFWPGTTVVTCIAIDSQGNMARCQFTVNVVVPPVEVKCPKEIVIVDCPAVVPDLTDSIELNYCGPLNDLTITQNPAPGTPVGPGTYVITVTVTDQDGNEVKCETLLTVVGPIRPVIICPRGVADVIVDDKCQGTIPEIDVVVSDDCTEPGSFVVTQNPAAGTLAGPGAHTVVVTVTDGSGNSAQCQVVVHVIDATPPVVVCATNLTAIANVNCEAVLPNVVVSVSDNCTPDAELIISQNPPAGTLLGEGTHVVTVTVTDASGNSASCQTTFTVSTSPQWQWAVSGGGTDPDASFAIARDSAGFLYVAGQFQGTATFGSTTLTSAGGNDVFVAKLDANGNFLWATRAGGPGADHAATVAVDSNGNVYIGGMSQNPATFGATTLAGGGFISKLDPNGNFIWTISAGNLGVKGLAIDASDNVYVTGDYFGWVTMGTSTFVSAGSNNVFIGKLDPNGTVLWISRPLGNRADGAGGIAVDSLGNVYVTGRFGYAFNPPPGSTTFGSTTLTPTGGTDAFITKLDNNGNFLWAIHGGGSGLDGGTAIALDAAGNAYVTGYFSVIGAVTFGSTTLTGTGYRNIFVTKVSPTGTFLWTREAGGTYYDWPRGIALNGSGIVHVTGEFSSATAAFGGFTLGSSGGMDVFLTQLDSAGNFLWAGKAGGPGNDSASGIALDPAGCIHLTGLFGSTANFLPLTLTSAGSSDAFVAKLCFPCVETNTPPRVTCPRDLALECSSPQGTPVTLTAQVTDDDGDALSYFWGVNGIQVQAGSIPAGGPPTVGSATLNWTFPAGTHTVTFTVTDSAGNVSACQFTVTIGDTVPPRILCPKGIITIPAGTNCLAELPKIHVKVSDNCTPVSALIVTQTPPPGSLLPPGIHTVIVTVTDAAGNQTSCKAAVRVLDLTAPIVKCPEPQTVVACQGAIPNVLEQTIVSDNCSQGAQLTITQTPSAGTLVNAGTHTITVTVVDAAGNAGVCSTTFTVQPPAGSLQPLALFNTGVDHSGNVLPDGAVDPHYTLITSADPNFPGPDARLVNSTGWPFPNWILNNATSKWIGPRRDAGASNPGGVYIYRTTFTLPAGAGVATINGRWLTDNGAVIRLNGNLTTHVTPHNGFNFWTPFTINAGFVPGLNTLDFVVTNLLGSTGGTPTGLRVELRGTVSTCPTNCVAPFIVQHPASVAKPPGSFATFSVSAGGSPVLSYQWFFNNSIIPGATSPTLTAGPISSSDAGLYSVLVSNGCGEIRSKQARLKLRARQPFIIGQWDFEPHNPLGATIGEDLEYLDGPDGETAMLTHFGSNERFGIPGIDEAPTHVMRFPRTTPAMGYLARAALDSRRRTLLNQHTFIWDLFFPEESSGNKRALLQANVENTDEAEFAINEENVAGAGDQFAGAIPPNTWTRVALAVDLESEPAVMAWYVNGRKTGERPIEPEERHRWEADLRAEDAMGVLFFTDGVGASEMGYVSSIQWQNIFLSELEVAALGGPSPGGIPVGSLYLIEPALSVENGGDGLRLNWVGEDFILQETAELGSSANWNDSTLPIQSELVGDEIHHEVTIPPGTGNRFYRLIENGR